MAALTEDDGPLSLLAIWVFSGIGLVIWFVGLVIGLALRSKPVAWQGRWPTDEVDR